MKMLLALLLLQEVIHYPVANGLHTIRAKARDAAGNTAVSEVVVRVTNPPTVRFDMPLDGEQIKSSPKVAVQVSADAPLGEVIVSTKVLIDGVQCGAGVLLVQCIWNVQPKGKKGLHTLSAETIDSGGNRGVAAIGVNVQ